MLMLVTGAIDTVRRVRFRCSPRLSLTSVAIACCSLSIISRMSATLSRAGAECFASHLRRDTIVSPSVGPLVLPAARSSTWSTSTVCCQNFPVSVLGRQEQLKSILATEPALHTLLAMAGTSVFTTVSGADDADKNAITTCLDDWRGMTGRGGVAVSGQVFANWRLRPPVGALFETMSLSASLSLLSVPASSSVRASSIPVSLSCAPSKLDNVRGGGAAPVEGSPVVSRVLEAVSFGAAGGIPRELDSLQDRFFAAARWVVFYSRHMEAASTLSALST